MYYIARYPNKDNVTVWRTTPLFANKVTLKAVVSGSITLDSTYVYGTTFDCIKNTVVGTSKNSSEALGIALLEKMKIEEDQIEEQKKQKQLEEQRQQNELNESLKMKTYLSRMQAMLESMKQRDYPDEDDSCRQEKYFNHSKYFIEDYISKMY